MILTNRIAQTGFGKYGNYLASSAQVRDGSAIVMLYN